MGKAWVILITMVIFLTLSFLFYKSMNGYVREAFGKKWLKIWGNKVYFWQSLLFVSIAATALIIFLLKWGNVLTF